MKICFVSGDASVKHASNAAWLHYLLRSPMHAAFGDAEFVIADTAETDLVGMGFVVGFELADALKKRCDDQKIVWLDLRIAPVRYLDDIYFTFETSHDEVWKRLQRYRIDDALFRYHADLVKATVIKQKKSRIVPDNTLLLVGQTERDRVVFDGERYLTLADKTSELSEIARRYDYVRFKPHPYAKNTRYLIRELRRKIGQVAVTRANIYHLLANDGVAHVAGLNSSVLYEAHHFGKETTFLHTPTFTQDQVGIYGDYFDAAFWADVLSPLFPTQPSELRLPFVSNRLRRTLNDFWGYNAIADEIVMTDILKEKIKNLLSHLR